jgi:hypothetical protein
LSFLKGPNTIYSGGLVLGYQYIVQGQKKSMITQKAHIKAQTGKGNCVIITKALFNYLCCFSNNYAIPKD